MKTTTVRYMHVAEGCLNTACGAVPEAKTGLALAGLGYIVLALLNESELLESLTPPKKFDGV